MMNFTKTNCKPNYLSLVVTQDLGACQHQQVAAPSADLGYHSTTPPLSRVTPRSSNPSRFWMNHKTNVSN